MIRTIPNTMTAVVQDAYGLDALRPSKRAIPIPGPGQIRIKVVSSSVNPMDWHLATGTPGLVRLVEGFRRPKHQIPGREAFGVIDRLGVGVTDFEVGQPVFGWLTGGLAEYAVAEADRVSAAPTNLRAPECAALPIAGAAALEAVDLGDVDGKRVLVNGASGGVGHIAVQIAKARGASWVAGVCSARNAALVRDLGADQVIDYETQDFAATQWDVAIDCIGNRSGSEIRRALVDDGIWIVVGDQDKGGLLGPLPRLVARLVRWRFGSRRFRWFVQGEKVHQLHELVALIEAGSVNVHVSDILALGDVRLGYERIESGRTVGKLLVDVAASGSTDSTDASLSTEVRR